MQKGKQKINYVFYPLSLSLSMCVCPSLFRGPVAFVCYTSPAKLLTKLHTRHSTDTGYSKSYWLS